MSPQRLKTVFWLRMEKRSCNQLRSEEHTEKTELLTCLHGSFVDHLEILEAEICSRECSWSQEGDTAVECRLYSDVQAGW